MVAIMENYEEIWNKLILLFLYSSLAYKNSSLQVFKLLKS